MMPPIQTDSNLKVHLFENGDTYIAYEHSAYILLFVLKEYIRTYPVYYNDISERSFLVAEINKTDFLRIVNPRYILMDGVYHKILDFHLRGEVFGEWMQKQKETMCNVRQDNPKC